MTRRPLSSVPEEIHFLAADEACDDVCARMKRLVLARFAAHGSALNRSALALAVGYGAPTALRMAMDARSVALAWAAALVPSESSTRKARKPKLGATEAELIDAALDAGIELGLETLPAKARKAVDVEAARRVARRRLMQGAFRQNLAALEESQRGLAVLVNASRSPALTVLKDPERIASMFGLNARQAKTLVRETDYLIEQNKKTEAIKRAMAKRLRQALEARAEVLSESLAREAIATAQQALYEQAAKQGLLDEETQLREWVTRRDDRVCPICDAFDGQRAAIDEPFVSTDGEEAFQPGIHPRCRCFIRLVKVKAPSRGRRAA